MEATFFRTQWGRRIISALEVWKRNWKVTAKVVNVENIRLTRAIGSFEPYKSLGPDGIYAVILRVRIVVIHTLVEWQKTRVIFILKSGDDLFLWRTHLQAECHKAKVTACQCKGAIRAKCGLGLQQVMSRYRTVIVPRLTYAAVLFF